AVSAALSMVPDRSMIPMPPSCRTVAEKRFTSALLLRGSPVAVLAEADDELHRPPFAFGGDLERIDHLPHEEDAPPPRRLLARELRLEVGRLRLQQIALAPVIDHAHRDRVRRR